MNKFFLTLLMLLLSAPPLSAQKNVSAKLDSIMTLINQKRYTEASDQLKPIISTCEDSPNDTVRISLAWCRACTNYGLHRYEEAIKYYKQYISMCDQRYLKGPYYAMAYCWIGNSYLILGDGRTAEKYYRRGLLRCNDQEDLREVRSYILQGLHFALQLQGDSVLAEESDKLAFAPQSEVAADDNYQSLMAHGEMQILEMRKNNQFEECLPAYDKLIAEAKTAIGIYSEDYARLVYSKALVLSFNLGRNEEAKPLYKEVMQLAPHLKCNENVLGSTSRYLQILAEENDTAKLTSLLPQAIRLYEECRNAYYPLCMLYRQIGNGAYSGEHFQLAIPYYELYLTHQEEEAGRSYLEIPNMLSVCYIRTGRAVDARSLLKRLLTEQERNLQKEENADLLPTIMHNYGRALMLCEKKKEAITMLKRANNLFKKLTGQENALTTQYLKECEKS